MTRRPDIIESRQHAIVKRFRAAAGGEDRYALIDGWHLLAEAVGAGLVFDLVAVTREAASEPDARRLDVLPETTPVVTVTTSVMAAISPVRTPTGVAALVERREFSLAAALGPAPALAVVAVDLQDPGNAGALVRAAEAGGATGVVLAGAAADPWRWKALRASMGSTFRLPVVRATDAARIADELAAANLTLIAAVPRGGIDMAAVDLARPTALLIGGEGGGLPGRWLDLAAVRISIPMAPAVESLNAAIAAAILVFEARRQRHAIERRRLGDTGVR
jgi:TrmH family RNA methyltransferase